MADMPLTDAALSRRAQLLATEHWGLLAARSTAQSEVLTRITIFLTLVSAGLVTIGLLGQVTRFSDWFAAAALAILGFLALIGLITHVRVLNASEEDMMYVVAMNRIRAAYVDLDPGVARYFLAAVNDDRAGMELTYSFLRRRSISHLLGSSMSLIAVVVACVFGLLAGAVLTVAGAIVVWAVVGGTAAGLLYVAVMFLRSGATFAEVWRTYRPLRATSDDTPGSDRDTPEGHNSENAA
jgi:hypothetical protein